MHDLETTIERAFDDRAQMDLTRPPPQLREAVDDAIALLDNGKARVAEPTDTGWRVNQWLKKAVLLSFGMYPNRQIDAGYTTFYDKVPLKF
ncbi:MAG: 2,3,4,5-tetrahydropyridine-2,6-dicarboxylate N-succinyltransferase, partial [Gammaproteobacteria bacterium]|nr:2,3,4,5-tetrahydropyridine-2,6-dicarboxylate N-succinyltransferase [Gammaproteobacteria bacterium]